jgi:photosystem II stability/assembly factor-like uncharacterized protein
MTLLDKTSAPSAPEQSAGPPLDAEALFKEAHQRRRRRWILGSTSVLALFVALCIAYSALGGAGGGTGSTWGGDRSGRGLDPPPLRSSSSFKALGTGVLASPLDCASEKTCFAVVDPQPGDALHVWPSIHARPSVLGPLVAKTVDGGSTWIRIRSFPRRWSPHPVMSCPTIEVCALAVQPLAPHNNTLPAQAIAITRDGGSTWKIHRLSLPARLVSASVNDIACVDGLECLAYVGQNPAQPAALLSTSDGGATWGRAIMVTTAASTGGVRNLQCDLDGRCIALAVVPPGWATLTSSDFGRTWTTGPQAPFPSSAVMNASCGDALHCVYSTEQGALAFTENAGQSWGLARVPVPSGQVITAVDCNTAMHCWAAAAQFIGGNYKNPVIYRSQDGGETWRSLEVPSKAYGWIVSTVTPLSCPSSEGCIAIAQTRPPSSQTGTKRVVISSF